MTHDIDPAHDATAVPREVRLLGGLLVAGQVLLALGYLVAIAMPGTSEVQEKLDLDQEAAFNTWWNVSLLYTGAVLALLCVATHSLPRSKRVAGIVLAGILAFLSLDEQTGLHEALGSVGSGGESTLQWLWPVLFSPVLLIAAWALVTVARAIPRGPRTLLLAGLALQAVAVILEASASGYLDHVSLYQTEVLAEESCEGLGSGLEVMALLWLCIIPVRRMLSPASARAAEPGPDDVAELDRLGAPAVTDRP